MAREGGEKASPSAFFSHLDCVRRTVLERSEAGVRGGGRRAWATAAAEGMVEGMAMLAAEGGSGVGIECCARIR